MFVMKKATPSENEADKVLHGTIRNGTAINTNVLNEHQVLEIRVSDLKGVDLAKRYSVSASLISAIKNQKVWAWL